MANPDPIRLSAGEIMQIDADVKYLTINPHKIPSAMPEMPARVAKLMEAYKQLVLVESLAANEGVRADKAVDALAAERFRVAQEREEAAKRERAEMEAELGGRVKETRVERTAALPAEEAIDAAPEQAAEPDEEERARFAEKPTPAKGPARFKSKS